MSDNFYLDLAVASAAFFGIAAVTIALFGGVQRILTRIPVSHKIAVIGLPGAGKTTLITALFEMIQRGVHIDRVHLHGMETIKTVNKYVAAIELSAKDWSDAGKGCVCISIFLRQKIPWFLSHFI